MAVPGAPALQSNYGQPTVTAPLPQAGQMPQPNVSDFGRGINGVPMPVNPYRPTAPITPAAAPNPIAPPPQLDFMTPAMQRYVNQFQQSQTAQQQAINAGLVQALSGLGQRRDAAAQVAATLPGEATKAYQEATANQALAQKNAGFGHETIGGNADQALITAANTQELAAAKGNQPLLNAGITADYSKGATTLQNTKMQNQAAVAQQQQSFDQQMLQAQAQYQQQQQDRAAGYQHDREMAQLQSDLALRNFYGENPQGKETPEDQALNQQSIKNGFTSYSQQQAVEQDPSFNWSVQVLQGTQGRGAPGIKSSMLGKSVPTAGDKASLVKFLSGNQLLLKALVANGYLTPNDIYGTPTKK
jgi:hypothetical protein